MQSAAPPTSTGKPPDTDYPSIINIDPAKLDNTLHLDLVRTLLLASKEVFFDSFDFKNPYSVTLKNDTGKQEYRVVLTHPVYCRPVKKVQDNNKPIEELDRLTECCYDIGGKEIFQKKALLFQVVKTLHFRTDGSVYSKGKELPDRTFDSKHPRLIKIVEKTSTSPEPGNFTLLKDNKHFRIKKYMPFPPRRNLFFFTTAYFPGIDLFEFITREAKTNSLISLTALEILDLLKSIADVYLAQIFNTGIVHLDIKPDNIIIEMTLHEQTKEKKFRINIIDPEYACPIGKVLTSTERRGTPNYIAPEFYEDPDVTCSPALDMFGLSRVMWTILGSCIAQVYETSDDDNNHNGQKYSDYISEVIAQANNRNLYWDLYHQATQQYNIEGFQHSANQLPKSTQYALLDLLTTMADPMPQNRPTPQYLLQQLTNIQIAYQKSLIKHPAQSAMISTPEQKNPPGLVLTPIKPGPTQGQGFFDYALFNNAIALFKDFKLS